MNTLRTVKDADKTRRALPFFRVMAVIVGIGLLVLVVEMILRYAFGMEGADNPLHWWPQPHGFIYMIYLVAVANLGLAARWSIGRLVGVMLAGCVPFVSFYVEHRMTKRVHAELAAFEAREENANGQGTSDPAARER